MPPQKNKGKKGAAGRESGVTRKNKNFVNNYMSDLFEEGGVDGVYISRVTKVFGNGRVEVFYVNEYGNGISTTALIRGSFRGKGKRDAWIEISSIVAVDVNDISTPVIVAIFDKDQIHTLKKEAELDPRIFAVDNVDTQELVKNKNVVEEGFEFEEAEAEDEDDNELTNNEIDAI